MVASTMIATCQIGALSGLKPFYGVPRFVFDEPLDSKHFVRNMSRSLSQKDYAALEAHVGRVIKEKQNFIRMELTKEQALEMFKVWFS